MLSTSRLAPSAANSGNYRAAPAMSPMGGGVLPSGGGDGSAGSGSKTEPVNAYGDGGVIPDDVEDQMNDGPGDQPQGAESATVDPMSVVKGALSFGRKAMGLPQSFFGGSQAEQGFDDGGEVEDQSGQGMIPGAPDQAAPAGGTQTPDPRKAIQYLTGAGALSPEQAQALSAQVDPQGQMDGSERNMKALQAAGSPQAQFGYLQSMRQKFNAFGAGARVAAQGTPGRPANLAHAAVAANQAFENLPSGHSIQFAPAKGGIAMMAKPHGQQQSMEDGGQARSPDDFLADQEPSTNVEDRRGEAPYEPTTGDKFKSAIGDIGRALTSGYQRRKAQLGFDEGGEVEGDGVIPDDTAAVTDAPEGQDDAGGDTSAQPTILTTAQFDKLVQPETFEKATEKGWGQTLSEILSAVSPIGSANAGELRKGGTVITGQNQPMPDQSAPQPGAQEPPVSGVQQGGMEGAPTKDNSWEARNMSRRGDDNAAMERYTNIANRLYPSVGQAEQRNAYIANMMQKDHEQQGKVDLQEHNNKGALETQRQTGRNQLADRNNAARLEQERMKQNEISRRSDANRQSKADQFQQAMAQKDRSSMTNFVRSEANSLRVAKPNITPQEIITSLAKTFNVDPNVVASLTQGPQGQGGAAPQGQQGQPQPRPQGANMDAAQAGAQKPYTKNGVTRMYEFGQDGMWHLMPEQQSQEAPQPRKVHRAFQ